MTFVHIYTAERQPATSYIDNNFDEPREFGFAPDRLLYTECCRVRRPASDCVVQCFYDGLRIWCAEGKGCEDPVVIAAKKQKAFENRSRGQRARRERERRWR
jgi:hypothetical protein